MDQGNYKNIADDELGQRLLLQQQRRQISSTNLFKASEERPYRRRIKPPRTKVHHVHPAPFRRFVQRRTCCPLPQQPNDDDATASTISISATTEQELQRPPPDAAIGSNDAATAEAGPIDATRKSMQDRCSSNDIPLSPGTMGNYHSHCIPATTKAIAASNPPDADLVTRPGTGSSFMHEY